MKLLIDIKANTTTCGTDCIFLMDGCCFCFLTKQRGRWSIPHKLTYSRILERYIRFKRCFAAESAARKLLEGKS